MGKLYLLYSFFLLVIFSTYSYAQAPDISYPTPLKFTVGIPVKPVQPVNTGGAVPNEVYSKAGTIAGSGLYGYKDTLAQFAMFENPISVAYDSRGNLYVADANLNMIRKISADGVVSTLAGNPTRGAMNGQGTDALFNYPTGVACDAAGNVYVADFGNNMIRKITPAGLVSTFAGHINSGSDDGIGTNARFTLPTSITIDKNGNLFVADTYNNKIRKITPAQEVTTFAGSGAQGFVDGPGASASFNVPIGIAVDADGFVYVTDQKNNRIRKINPAGYVSTLAFTSELPVGIAVDNLKRIYFTTQKTFHITQLNPDGKPSSKNHFSGGSYKTTFDSIDTLSSYKGAMQLTFDGKNNLLIADAAGDKIRKVAINGYGSQPLLPDGLTLDGTGKISGTPTVLSPAKNYVIKAYNGTGIDSATINISIGIGSQKITFNKFPKVTYGDKNFIPPATSTNNSIPIVYTSSNLAVAKIVNGNIYIIGAGTATITANQPANRNYTAAAPVTQKFTVNKAKLTITATDITKTAGKANPELKFTYSGFVNTENDSVLTTKPTVKTSVTSTTPAGVYPITVAGAAAANYTFIYVAGKLTVFPVPVISAIGSTNIVKGGSVTLTASPATGYSYQWALDGVNIAGATKATYAATQTGAYTVLITKDSYTTYSNYISVLVQLQLPANNFNLAVTSVTCKGSNNGTVDIDAVKVLKYTALITGNGLNTTYHFTDKLKISDLSPGNYSICMSVDDEIFSQCFQINVTEPKDLSVYSTINTAKNSLNLQLDGGTSYKILLNSTSYNTTQSQISIPLARGYNKLSVTTDKLCQGVIEKTIIVDDNMVPFPNPFQNVLNVNIGNENIRQVDVNVINFSNGKPVYKHQYTNQSGVLQVDLSNLAAGLYYLNLSLDNQRSGYKIIKK